MPRNHDKPATIQIVTCIPTGRTLITVRTTPVELLPAIQRWPRSDGDRHKARAAMKKYGPDAFTYAYWPSSENRKVFVNRKAAEPTARELVAEHERLHGEGMNGRRGDEYED